MRARRRVGLVSSLVLLGLVPYASAQTAAPSPPRLDRSFDLQTFHPAIGARSFITLDSAQVLEHRLWHFGMVASYAREPFSYKLSGLPGNIGDVTPVANLATAHLVSAVGLWNRLEVGMALPVAVSWGGEGYDRYGRGTALPTDRVVGLGDLRVEGKGQVAELGADRAFVLAVSAGGTVPTGDGDGFMGERSVSGRLRGLLEYKHGDGLRAVVTAGGLFRQRSEFLGTPLRHALLYGGAVELRPHLRMGVVGEVTGRVSSGYSDTNPAELDLGMRFYLRHMVTLLMGGGFGLNQGVGSPRVRAFLGLSWAPDYRNQDGDRLPDVDDRCPEDAEDVDGFHDEDGCPEPDNDGDGLLDTDDRCPEQAEDLDGHEDGDGCPEPDNDGDGVLDLNDACIDEKEDGQGKRPTDGCPSTKEDSDADGVPDPTDKCADEAEDKDGFEDTDGCPDYDNDGDGIPDTYDVCPSEAEDPDGFDDNDGCPDADNDHDGISDAEDKCPGQPETLNKVKDDDGCPDGPALVSLGESDQAVFVAEHINFFPGAGGKPLLTTNSQMLVALVARAIKSHPEVELVRIEITAKDGSKEGTEERGRTLVRALVKNGVEARRLKVAGLGDGPNRVELVIEGRGKPASEKPPQTEQSDSPAPDAGSEAR